MAATVFVYSTSTPTINNQVGQYATIQEAIDSATTLDGYSIFVDADGTYDLSTPLNITKSLGFFGEQNEKAGTAGNRTAETVLKSSVGSTLFNIAAPGLTVSFDGFTMQADQIVASHNVADFTIANSILKVGDSRPNAIYFGSDAGAFDFTFTDNKVELTGNSSFIQLFSEGDVDIARNVFTGIENAAAGNDQPVVMNLNGVAGSVTGNMFDNVDNGIVLAGASHDLTLSGNTFQNIARDDVAVDGYAAGIVFVLPAFTGPIVIEDNIFRDSDAAIRTSSYSEANKPAPSLAGLDITIDDNQFTGVERVLYVHDTVSGVLAASGSTVDGQVFATLSAADGELIFASTSANEAFIGDEDIEVLSFNEAITTDELSYSGNGVWTVTTDGGNGTDTIAHFDKVRGTTGTILLVDKEGSYTTIQAAVDAAADGDTILVADGVYVEQVTVSGRANLTIEAAVGATVTVKSPDVLGSSGTSGRYGEAVYAVVGVTGSTGIVLRNIAIDGDYNGDSMRAADGGASNGYELTGVAYLQSSGTLDNVDVAKIGDSPTPNYFGDQRGSGLFIDGTGTSGLAVEVANSAISDFQKTGVLIFAVAVDFHDNSVAGIGATGLTGQNGIQIGDASGTISGNTVGGLGYVVPNGGVAYYAAGILAYEPSAQLTISGNTITGVGAAGEFAGVDVSDTAGVNIAVDGNTFANATYGIYAASYVGGALGLDTATLTGNTFTGITREGIHFAPEEVATGGTFSTDNGFAVTGTQFADTLAGSNGADSFSGGDGNDVLTGDAGNDSLDGGAGDDTAVYTVDAADAVVAGSTTNGRLTAFTGVSVADGADTLSGIERLQFADRTLSLADPVQLFDASNHLIGTFGTIQAAVDAAGTGSAAVTIVVADGNYAENVVIARDNVTLLSVNGRGATTIAGVQTGGEQGAIELKAGADHVTIGTADHGFTILGLNGNGVGEKAAIYLRGAHDTLSIAGNEVVARGDLGLVTEYGANVAHVVIDGNTFSGQTFEGQYVSAFSVGQFAAGNNVPRQLVAINPGSSDVIFSNNLVSGTTGAEALNDEGNPSSTFRGNQLVTIDAADSTIDNNVFSGSTLVDYSFALRVRGSGTDVTNNVVTGDSPGIQVSVPNGGVAGSYTGNSQTGTTGNDVIVSFTPGDDTLSGLGGDDILAGSGGADLLDGGTGTDTALYYGARSAYTVGVSVDGDGRVTGFTTVSGPEGSDTLVSIEKLAFNGGALVLDPAQPVQLFDAGGNLTGTFDTIQAAVNAASVGGTVRIAAGDYAEDVVIQTAGVTLVGAANHATTIRPASSDATDGNVVTVLADNVTIQGLTITGTNSALDSGGAGVAMPDGTVSHAARLVSNYQDARGGGVAIDGLHVTGNDLSAAQSVGVMNFNSINQPGNPGVSGGSVVSGNTFHDIAGIGSDGNLRDAVYFGQEAYTDVLDNVMTDVGTGVETISLGVGDPVDHAVTRISGNTISAQLGIFINNHYGAAAAFEVSNNDIGVGAHAVQENSNGIRIWSIFNGATVTVADNDITGAFYGYRLANNPGDLVISGGSVTSTDAAVSVYDTYGYGVVEQENRITLSGVAIGDSRVAHFVIEDSTGKTAGMTLAFDATNPPSLGSAPVDVQLNGDTAKFDANGYTGALSIVGNGADNELAGGAGDDTLTGGDGTDTAQFEGAAGAATVTGTQDAQGRYTGFTQVTTASGGTDTLAGVEKIAFTDGATTTTLSAGDAVQLFDGNGAIVGTFATIQAAIDAAQDGYTIRAAAGTYTENLQFDVGVTLLGAHLGEDGDAAGRGAASAGETNLIGRHDIVATAAVTIDGVRFVNTAATSNGGASDPILYIRTGGAGDGHVVEHSVFYSEVNGAANGRDDRAIATSVIAEGAITINDNYITGAFASGYSGGSWGRAVWFDGGGVDLTVTGNTIEYSRSGVNLDMSGDSTAVVSDNLFTTTGTAVAAGVDTVGLTITDNDFNNAGEEFNFRNETVDVTFDAETAVDAQTGAYVDVLGGDGNDHLSGSSYADLLDGNQLNVNHADNDLLEGRGGADVLIGRAGNDTLVGGADNDALFGGAGTDTAVVTAGYTLATSGSGWTVTSSDGIDALDDVEIVSDGAARTLLVGNGGYDTLAAAVLDAQSGDTIVIAAGSYAGNTTIDKAVTIKGAQAGNTGAVGRGAESVLAGQLTITADVTIDGVEILNGSGTAAGFVGITVQGAADVTVRNSLFYSTAGVGSSVDRAILLATAATGDVVIANNAFTGAQQGAGDKFGTANWSSAIWSDGRTASLNIVANAFDNVRGGINLDSYDDGKTVVENNLFTTSGSGISIGTPVTTTITGIRNNVFTDVDSDFNLQNVTTGQSFDLAATGNTGGGTGIAAAITVLGTQGNDTLTGGTGSELLQANGGNDRLFASAGNDAIVGGGGNDTYVLGGTFADYTTTANADGSYTIVSAAEGTDTVSGVEFVEIGGQSFAIAALPDDAPVAADDANPVADPVKEDVDASTAGNVLTNDTNSDAQFGDTLRVTAAGAGAEGSATLAAVANGTTVDGIYGVLTINTDGSYSYALDNSRAATQALAAGATVIDRFAYRVADNAGQSDVATLSVSVAGTNDAPVLTTTAAPVFAFKESTGTANDNYGPVGGTLAVNDVDTGNAVTGEIVSVVATWNGPNAPPAGLVTNLTTGENGGSALTFGSVVPDGAGANLSYTYDPGAASVNQLSEEQTLTLTYTVRVKDAASSSAATQQIVVTVTGTNEIVMGTADDDVLNGGSSADDITGGDGDDSISGAGGDDDIDAGAGDDSVLAGAGNDTVFGGDGDDSIDGGSDNDLIYGGAGDDTLNGGSGNDVIYTGPGNDSVNGGSGTDTLVLDGAWSDYTITRVGSAYMFETATQQVIATAIENVTFTGNTGNDGPFAIALTTNDAPVAVNDLAAAATGNVLTNDTDADIPLGDVLAVNGVRTGAEAAGGTFDAVPAGKTVTGTYGTLTINPDGTYSYAVDPSDPQTLALGTGTGTESFTYRVVDAKGLSDTATLSFTVTGSNVPPVAVDDSFTTAEDSALTLTAAQLTANDTDANGNTLSLQSVGNASGGTVTLVNGVVTFTPNADYNGPASFDYVVSDGTATDTGTVNVTVTPVNDVPVAAADSYTATEDTVFAGSSVLANDSDVESTLTATLVSGPSHGTLAFNADGTFTYTPTGNFAGNDTFTYTASDGTATSAPTTVTIAVAPVNDAPVAANDSYAVAEDGVLSVSAAGVLANDIDVDGPSLSAVLGTGPANGALVLNADGSFAYTPNADFAGTDSFTYTASDGSASSAAATVTITVAAVNDAPVAVDDNATVAEDAILSGSVATNDGDVDSGALTYSTASTADGLTFNSDGSYTLDATGAAYQDLGAGEQRDVTVAYQVSDGALADTGTLTITVTGVNDAPVANADTLSATEDTPATFAASMLIGNDTDVDGEPLTLVSVINGTGGSVSLNTDGTFTFAPDTDFNGAATFTYTVSDGTTSTTGTATVNVAAVNDAPTGTATATLAAGTEDTAYIVSKADLLQGFSDVDGGPLSVINLVASNGSVVDNGSTYTITPAADFNGTMTLTYQVSDGQAATAASQSYAVAAVNDAPVAVADTFNATEDQPTTFTAAQLVANDSDVDTGDTLSVTAVSSGIGGTVSLSGGVVTFTPTPNFNGAATFSYTLSDGTTTTQGSATVNVAAVNDTATITGTRTGSVTEDGTLTTSGDLDIADVDTGEAVFAGTSGTRPGTY
ncbi:tandem-95 repeat protein, partial [Sphingomonas sp.]|uniref:tandem-95 repeat protein n=1 Tax=Sphingomonas sp. TaxID=28214 RepID=UPI0035BBF0FA